MDGVTTQTWLIHLNREECESRLAASTLGRLAVIVGARPEIFPVSYIVDSSGCVAFPTDSGTKLASALDWPWIGFEIDGVESDRDEGWSVMIVGRAEEIVDSFQLTWLREHQRVGWRRSGTEQWLRVVPTKVTGRRISTSNY